MNISRRTSGLAAAGMISLASLTATAEESVMTALQSTTLSGYIDTSYVRNLGNTDYLPGRTYYGPMEKGFNVNVVSLTLDKPIEDDGGWNAGYHVQFLFGPGAHKRGTGLINSGGADADVATNEAYIALLAPVGNGLTFRIGQYGTYNGYEGYDTPGNAHFSRSFGFFIENSAHTGVDVAYDFNDYVSAKFGVGNSGPTNIDARSLNDTGGVSDQVTYLGMINVSLPEDSGFLPGAGLALGYTSTMPHGADEDRFNNLYFGGSAPITDTLSLGFAFDFSEFENSAPGASDVDAWTLAGYVSYQATEKLGVHGRVDYATSDGGVFGSMAPAGDDEELLAFTATLDYSLWDNVISRVEARYDLNLDDGEGFGTVNGEMEDDNIWFALNVIYVF